MPKSIYLTDDGGPLLNTQALEAALGFQFLDRCTLTQALTHRSFSADHYERLEFLGDSIVNFLIGDELFRRFPEASEGQLTRLRARLVKGETLAEIAREKGLGQYIRLGLGEKKTGGESRVSILADVLEALVAAVYLEGGLEGARRCVLSWFALRLETLRLDDRIKDPKSRLQELLQSKQLALPVYDVIAITGAEHNQHFTIRCSVDSGRFVATGEGSNRKAAEQQAATEVLDLLEEALTGDQRN